MKKKLPYLTMAILSGMLFSQSLSLVVRAENNQENRPQSILAADAEEAQAETANGDPRQPLYRLYHPGLQAHLYTKDKNEYNILAGRGWNQEGVAFQTNTSIGKPVYRMYHPGLRVHLYTQDKNEYSVLATRGWNQEGEAYKSYGTVPIYRLYHPGIKKHLYTKDANEYNTLGRKGWNKEGVAFMAMNDGWPIQSPAPEPTPLDQLKAKEAAALKDLQKAKEALAQAKLVESRAQSAISAAKQADAQKANQINSLTRAVQTKTAEVSAAQQKVNANQAKVQTAEKAVTDATATLTALQTPKTSPVAAQIATLQTLNNAATTNIVSWDVPKDFARFMFGDDLKMYGSAQTTLSQNYAQEQNLYRQYINAFYNAGINADEQNYKINLANISDDELIVLAQYSANVINMFRTQTQKQLDAAGSDIKIPLVQVTVESLAGARQYMNWLAKNYPGGYTGHVVQQAVASSDLQGTFIQKAQEEDVVTYFYRDKSMSLSDVKIMITEGITSMLFDDADSGWGHTASIIKSGAKFGASGLHNMMFSTLYTSDGNVKIVYNFTTPDQSNNKPVAMNLDAKIADLQSKATSTVSTVDQAAVAAAQSKLDEAKTNLQKVLADKDASVATYNAAQASLKATTDQLNALKATPNKTPAAESVYTKAIADRKTAETNLTNAQKAYTTAQAALKAALNK
ncbi:adhesion protein [Streptococcus varani]|uniref:Adhesion protein n=1 Tax=Streptococcus varani TaxID=1608583 RepID=A0A0E3WFC5_9STRE|nr:SEC10/PgrA surface exclusion domain-containing protein [Streptococcus varani]CQR25266.1 adhesion protein [Streptococcus varani]